MYMFLWYWEQLPAKYSNSWSGKAAYDALRTYYAEPWRYYHTWHHVEKMQACLDEIEIFHIIPLSVRIAGYFHDAIWLPGYTANEEKSADLATKWLNDVGCDPLFIDDVQTLILATVHSGYEPEDSSEAMIRDADLATLGSPDWDYFSKTQKDIRKEFANVPEEIYLEKRRELFQRMCVKQVFWHPYMHTSYESFAVQNLQREGLL